MSEQTTQHDDTATNILLLRFQTGQALRGRLMQGLMDAAGAGDVLPAGTQLGPWRLIQLIASGGMSHVYLAERADGQFEQTVALKLVRHNAALLARLRHERQIVAMLRHPHIVSLVDGGETDSGDLWFAMALVDGLALDEYAFAEGLDWRRRLQLFDQVCAAVEYAHGRALIHRDLKPANILVDAHGHPRLLDFGIALDGDLEDGSDDHVLTPGFASPEQKSGGQITTASDVYQLGLVLRALLDWKKTGQGKNAPVMPPRVGADLRRVLARGSAEAVEQRYGSVSALREDLSAVLNCQVLAEDRQRVWPRWQRFAERNRLALGVAALGAALLITVLLTAAWRLRAERNEAIANAQRAEAVSGFLVDTLSQANPSASKKGQVTILAAMDQAAASLDQGLAKAPQLRHQLRDTIGSIYLSLDEPERCLQLVDGGEASSDASAASDVDQARFLILKSECHLAKDERAPAYQLLDDAQAKLAHSTGTTADGLLSWVLADRAQLLALDGKIKEANRDLEQALPLARSVGLGEQEYRILRFLGGNAQTAGEDARAVELLEQAHDVALKALGEGHRSTLTTAGLLAIAQARVQRWQEADATIATALKAAKAIQHRQGGAEIVTAQLLDNHAALLRQQGRFDECIERSAASLEIYQRLAEPGSSQGFNPSWGAAACAYQKGDWAQAQHYGEIALHYGELGAPVGFVNAMRLLAAVNARTGKLAESRAWLDRANAQLEHTEIANASVFSALWLTEALWHSASGDTESARRFLAKADEHIRSSGLNPGWLQQERDSVASAIK